MKIKSRKKSVIALILVGILAVGSAAALLPKPAQSQQNKTVVKKSDVAKPKPLLVTVVNASVQTQQPLVVGFGEAKARWSTTLTSEVNGRIDYVSDKLLVGSRFNKGDLLARINAVDYESALASTQADVAEAEVTYLEQRRETQQAKKRWELSGLQGNPSALTLKTPQLAQALAALKSAKAALLTAEKNITRTEIVAPFNGRVSSRNIDLGGYVSAGSEIGDVFATDIVEINIALNEQQFALIGSEAEAVNRAVSLVDTANSDAQWTAKIIRFEYHLDTTARTRNLVLAMSSDKAAELLLPGTFVKAYIPGKSMDNLLKVPASSLSRNGNIWYVNEGILQRFKAEIAYRDNDYLVIKGMKDQNRLQVVRYPQSSFLPGQTVTLELVATIWDEAEGKQTVADTRSQSKGDGV